MATRRLIIAGAIATFGIAAAIATAQTTTSTLSAWIGGSISAQIAAADQARDTVRAQIAAIRQARGTTVASSLAGRWQSTRFVRDAYPWHLQLQRNVKDGTISGRITVAGSGTLSVGSISGKITDTDVSGVITNQAGTRLGTFAGSLFAKGMSGTYETADGDVGTWSYAG